MSVLRKLIISLITFIAQFFPFPFRKLPLDLAKLQIDNAGLDLNLKMYKPLIHVIHYQPGVTSSPAMLPVARSFCKSSRPEEGEPRTSLASAVECSVIKSQQHRHLPIRMVLVACIQRRGAQL